MAYDGRVKFDTKLDTEGLKKGLDSAAGMAKKASTAITATIGIVTGAAIKVGSDFEAAMSNVYAISLATGENAEKLKKAAVDAGETTKFSSTEAANALEYLSLAGYNAENSIKALPKVLNLAAAGGMDLAYTSDLLTDSMAVMGLRIEDMDNFSDQLAMAASKANTSVAQLGEAVLIAGGQAKLCGMDVAEINTALGILADKGIKGSEGGTALRNVLKNLYTPTKQAADELERLGVVTSENGKLRNVQDVLIDLNKALSSLKEDEKVKSVGEIFDTRTIAAATNLLDDCNGRWNELEGYLRDCDGASARMAETMQDNLKGKLELVSSAAESCGIAFYDSISTPLKDAAEEGASHLSNLSKEMQQGELKEGIEALGNGLGSLTSLAITLARDALPGILKTTGFLCENASVLVPLIIGTVGAVKSYTAATTVAQTVTALFNATITLNPFGLAAAGIVALTAATVAVSGVIDNARGEVKKLREEYDNLNDSLDDSLKATAVQANECERYADKISDLLKVENRTAREKEELAFAVEKLNKLMPDLNLTYDKEADVLKDVNGELKDNIDFVYDSIEAMEKKARAEAYYEHYKKALEEQIDLEIKMEEQLQKVYDAENEIAELRDEYAYSLTPENTSIDPDTIRQQIELMEIELQREKETLESMVNLWEDYGSTATDWYSKYEGIGKAMMEGSAEGIAENSNLAEEAMRTAMNNVILAAKQAIDSHSPSRKFRDEIGATIPQGVAVGIRENAKHMTKAFDEAMDILDRQLEAEVITEEEYYAEMEKNRDKYLSRGTEEWLDATQELYEGTKKLEDEAIEEELELLEFHYNTGLITEEEYYKELRRIRDTYFTDDKEEWRKYTEKLVDYERDKAEDIIDVIEDTTDKIKDAYEDAFDNVNDSIEDMTEGIRDVGDFYVTGTVEINGKEVEYGQLVNMDKRNEWYEELYKRVVGVKSRLKNNGFTDDEIDTFWEHFRGMGEEGMYEYGKLLLSSSDADFLKQVNGYIEGEGWGQKIADLVYADDKMKAEEEFVTELENILTEAGKELPDNFWELGDLSGENFSESFLEGVRSAIAEAKSEIHSFLSDTGFSDSFGGYSATYNFYSSGQTVSEQLSDASRNDAIERARYG